MKRLSIACLLLLLINIPVVNAAEVTTCIIDSTVKSNPRVYFFPITSTELRCDHVIGKANVTLSDLYKDGWKLIQVISPILFEQKTSGQGYSPVILYLERKEPLKAPPRKEVTDNSTATSDDTESDDPAEESQGGSFFNWLKVEPEEEDSSE